VLGGQAHLLCEGGGGGLAHNLLPSCAAALPVADIMFRTWYATSSSGIPRYSLSMFIRRISNSLMRCCPAVFGLGSEGTKSVTVVVFTPPVDLAEI